MFETLQIIVDPRRIRWDNREAFQFENGEVVEFDELGGAASTPVMEV